MGFNKEISKLEEQLQLITPIKVYTDRNLELLNESHAEIRKIISLLYRKHANIFGNLYNYDLKEIRNNRKNVSLNKYNNDNHDVLIVYIDSLKNTIERTIEYIEEYVH